MSTTKEEVVVRIVALAGRHFVVDASTGENLADDIGWGAESAARDFAINNGWTIRR